MRQQGKSSIRLVHLTDPHLSHLCGVRVTGLRGKRWSGYASWHKNRKKKYLGRVLDRLTQAVAADNPDHILLTGDLVQIGLESEISQAADWLGRLGPAQRVMLVPGNHDLYAKDSAGAVQRFWQDYLFAGTPAGDEGFTRRFPVVRREGELCMIGLSTARVTPTFMATGELGNAQIERLSGLLAQADSEGLTVVLLIHHPPLAGMTKWRKALKDAAALESVLAQHPPALVFHGHLHHNRELMWGNSRVYCTSAASSAGDASYRIVDIERNGASIGFRMRLKSIAIGDTGEVAFITVDEQTWEMPGTRD